MTIPEVRISDRKAGDTWPKILIRQKAGQTPVIDFTQATIHAQMRETAGGQLELVWQGPEVTKGVGFFELSAASSLLTNLIRPGFYTIEVEVTLNGVKSTYCRLKRMVLEDYVK